MHDLLSHLRQGYCYLHSTQHHNARYFPAPKVVSGDNESILQATQVDSCSYVRRLISGSSFSTQPTYELWVGIYDRHYLPSPLII